MPENVDIYQRLTPADRFHQGCTIGNTAHEIVARWIRQENPPYQMKLIA